MDGRDHVARQARSTDDSAGTRSRDDSGSSNFVLSLLERIRKLESRLGLDPQNSSLPPSTQHPHARPQLRKRKSKKQRGGHRQVRRFV